MLDDRNWLSQRDPGDTLGAVMKVPEQLGFDPEIVASEHDGRALKQVVIAGMGGSALAADMVAVLARQHLRIPYVVVKGYELPQFVGPETLVVAISHSGNTEETLNCYQQARERGCQLAAMSTGGKLLEQASADEVVHVAVPSGQQPRMSTVYHLRGLLTLLQHFGVMDGRLLDELTGSSEWLKGQLAGWAPEVATLDNYAKQLAHLTIGKTPVFYGGELTAPLAYKWKISWNESAKNIAFCNQYPEFNHNEFIGWSSHPVEKPFAIFDLRSGLERARIIERMELSDRLLSGLRPKAVPIILQGETLVQQFLWALCLGDMASIYTATLNGVNPEPVPLVEKLKKELS